MALLIWKLLFTLIQLATVAVAITTAGVPFWPRIPPSSILLGHHTDIDKAPTVTTANGPFAGFVTKTRKGSPVYTYLGIPYALPPTGERRFRAPEPLYKVTEEVRDATKMPPACPQPEEATELNISEDCLHLNVFTTSPPGNSTAGLPVLVFIHGGNFATGDTGSVTGTKLLAHGGGVLVSVHYRLGALGFLSTDDEASPGNYGLKDIALSLTWVRDNIEFFGGNPARVTVFGVSAGSAAAILLMISPLTQGLVHGVIAESGTPFDTWNSIKDPLIEAEELASELGCSIESTGAIIKCLRGTPWKNITAVTGSSWRNSYENYATRLKYTLPTIEPYLPGAFISADPVELLKEGKFKRIPVIIGNVIQEGLSTLASFYQLSIGPKGLDRNPAKYKQDILIPIIKNFDNERESEAIADAAAKTYLPPGFWPNFQVIAQGIADIISVFWMKATVLDAAEILSGKGTAVYLYSLEQFSNNSLWNLGTPSDIPIKRNGAVHGDDMIFLFDYPLDLTYVEEKFSQTLTELWMNFARTGNPTPSGSLNYPLWPRYSDSRKEFMKLSTSPTIHTDYTKTWKTTPTPATCQYILNAGRVGGRQDFSIIVIACIFSIVIPGMILIKSSVT